ncbi:MAG: hypothetical protein U0871_15395 [Gemmataceae bacterium]
MSVLDPLVEWPPDRDSVWRQVAEFVASWHREPLGPASGTTAVELDAAERRLGGPLPAALREWQLLAGRRFDLWDEREEDRYDRPGPEVWAPASYYRTGDGPDAPVVFHVVYGGMVWYHYVIRAGDLTAADPPVFTHPEYPPGRAEFDSVSKMAATLLLVRANLTTPYRLCLLRKRTPDDPTLSRMTERGAAAGLWRRCEWVKPFFDPISSGWTREVHVGAEVLVLRGGPPRFHVMDTENDSLALAAQSPAAMRTAAAALGVRDRLPDEWPAEKGEKFLCE